MLHRGFRDASEDIYEAINEKHELHDTVYLTGHSLGGAIAMIMGYWYDEAGKEVHLNLKEVQYMDSSGISVLIESHQKAAELGTKVILKEISKSVLKVIMMAKLEQILIIE